MFERSHIVQPVCQLHHNHANILSHCQEHAAEVLGLALGLLEKFSENLESLVTPSTSCRTSKPKYCSISSGVTGVSSTTSCRKPAAIIALPPPRSRNKRQRRRDGRCKVLPISGTDLDAAGRQIQTPDKSARHQRLSGLGKSIRYLLAVRLNISGASQERQNLRRQLGQGRS